MCIYVCIYLILGLHTACICDCGGSLLHLFTMVLGLQVVALCSIFESGVFECNKPLLQLCSAVKYLFILPCSLCNEVCSLFLLGLAFMFIFKA